MSWESEFTSQWQTFLDTVETRVRRESANSGKLDTVLANAIIQAEVSKWFTSSHYHGIWLRNLAQQYPLLGEEFQASLKELRPPDLKSFTPPTLVFPLSAIAGFMIMAFLALGWQGTSTLRQFLGAAAIGVVAAPFFMNLWSSQKAKVVDALVRDLLSELDIAGNKLREIAVRADKAG